MRDGGRRFSLDFKDGRIAEYDAADLDLLDLGYATTVHKSQGSEYKSVMETCRTFCRTAPVTKDMRELGFHYQLVNAYIHGLQMERKFGPRTDENGAKRRQTAAASVERVAEEYQKKFSSFKVTADDQYEKCIGGIINTVLMVWIQYRDAYISIK